MSKSIQLHIEGMTCTSCASAVEKALAKVPTVQVAQVNFAGRKALLEVGDDTGELQTALRKAVTDAGYAVVDPLEKRAQAEAHVRREWYRLVWSWVLTGPPMILMLLHMVWMIHPIPMNVYEIIAITTSAIVIFGIGWPIIRSTLHSFRTLNFTMDSLIGIGAAAAFSTGLLRMAGIEIGDFTVVGAMIIAINFIGNYIKVKATGRAGSAIQKLLELGARQATRINTDGTEEVVEATELAVGDVVRVRPGEKVPSDGIITRGTTSIDESIVSGESIPVDKEVGSPVIGATINQMGAIDVRIEKTGADTFLSQIVDLVEQAQASRVPVQELADKVTAIFVPAILILASLTFAGWMIGTSLAGEMNVSAALSAAIATLVIACPCALGLATPTALMVGMGYGAERGVLIRNGEAIQTARDLNMIVFDKTGTLTVGRPEVRRSVAVGSDGTDHGEISPTLRGMILAVEQESEHPLARAVCDWAREAEHIMPARAEVHTTVVPGHGIRGTLGDTTLLVGSLRWLAGEGVTGISDRHDWKQDGMTVVGVAQDGKMTATLGLADAMKADAAAAIEALHKRGLKTAMLTGDNEIAARAIAAEAGIDEVFAELLPEQKIDAVRQLQAQGHTVAMVGDGINDAPALKQANVGIAIGTGTDIAIESADVTLMSSSLGMIPRAVDMSRDTFRKITTNLFWAFFYNLVAIPLAVAGLLHPVVAEIAMAFSSITVVTNSLHLRRVLKKGEKTV